LIGELAIGIEEVQAYVDTFKKIAPDNLSRDSPQFVGKNYHVIAIPSDAPADV